MGRSCSVGREYKGLLKDAGFVDVVETVYKWPINRWPKDKKMKEIGEFALFLASSFLPGRLLQILVIGTSKLMKMNRRVVGCKLILHHPSSLPGDRDVNPTP